MSPEATFARWALLDRVREARSGIHGPVNRVTFECGPAYPETLARYNKAVQALLEFDIEQAKATANDMVLEAEKALCDHLSKVPA